MWLPLALAVLGSGHVDHVNAASNDLMLDNVAIVTVDGTQTPGNGWSDSYSEGDRCYCDSTNYDHGIGTVIVSTPCGDLTVIEACDLIAATKPAGSSSANRPVYNDIQCGNGPPNNAGDEDMVRAPFRSSDILCFFRQQFQSQGFGRLKLAYFAHCEFNCYQYRTNALVGLIMVRLVADTSVQRGIGMELLAPDLL